MTDLETRVDGEPVELPPGWRLDLDRPRRTESPA